ncbi:angio-associated migratory cell protein-like [Abrus precatorius]|uniref:Angio-associated migratory cell protein-like n=1 Tax=Abrus precatorius TaxID=3816 RepID=A0A8B8KGP3_ABRPR|nr:angio-associated migratory cell protein-like [Abrus precatorius]
MNFHDAVCPFDDEDDDGEVYIDESDIIDAISLDDEDLPDADDDSESDHEANDDAVRIFKLDSSKILAALGFLLTRKLQLYSVACSPTDASLVAAGGNSNEGFIWRIGQEDLKFHLQGHTDSISSLAFSYDGQFLASGSLDGNVRVWDAFGNLQGELEGPGAQGGIEWIRWHPREHKILAGCSDSTVWMWDAVSFNFLNIFGHGDGRVTCGDFTSDGSRICAGSEDSTLMIRDVEGGGRNHILRRQPGHPYHTDRIKCLAISSTSTLALTGSEDGSIYLANINTGRVIDALAPRSESIECVGFAPSCSWAAVGGMDEKLIIWDIEHSLFRDSFNHEHGVSCLAWLGAWNVAAGCVDGKVRLWDSRSGECVKKFMVHKKAIESLSVSADQNFLFSASIDGKAVAYDMRM